MLPENVKYSPYAWWLTSISYYGGDVMILGALPIDDIYYLCSIAKNVFCLDFSKSLDVDFSNVVVITKSEIYSQKYDAIIISPEFELDNYVKITVLENYLKKNGVLTQYKMVRNGIFHGLYNLMQRFYQILFRSRSTYLTNNKNVDLPCVSYGSLPYEAFVRGTYHTNKNINLLKEKVKSYLYNSFFCDYFVNSYISILYKDIRTYFFEDILNSKDEFIKYGKFKFTKIYYKYGKLILSYYSQLDNSKYIVVISLDKSAIDQRNNEEKTISYLKDKSLLSKYVVNNYLPFKYLDLNCVFMDEVIGITVDAFSKNIGFVSENVYNIIKFIAINTKNETTTTLYKAELLKRYSDEFSYKLPRVDILESINTEELANKLSSIPMVLMHGDSKIENFVVDKRYAVSKIIDLELSELVAFPILDLIYFIVYNIQIETNCDFLDAYELLLSSDISQNYLRMIDDYMKELSITNEHRKILMGVFLLHHYAKRVVLTEGVTDEYLSRVCCYLTKTLVFAEEVL